MADLTPAEKMRVMLAAMKSEGWTFDRAWSNATQRIRAQPYMDAEERRELAAWKQILENFRPFFEAAYNDTPAPESIRLRTPRHARATHGTPAEPLRAVLSDRAAA